MSSSVVVPLVTDADASDVPTAVASPASGDVEPRQEASGLVVVSDDQPVVRHLSPSSASTFRQCPQRWKYRYVERLPDPKGIPALVGTFVHRILEELLDAPPSDRTLDAARVLARRLWPEVNDDPDFQDLGLSDEAQRGVRWQSWRLVEGYFAMEDPTGVEVAEREQHLEVELQGVPFVGVVDRTDVAPGGVLVTDYKTGRAPSARYVDGRLDQVWLYAAALQHLGHDVGSVRLLYLGSESIERPLDQEAVDAAVDVHRGTWDGIAEALERDAFTVRTGPLCGWCPYLQQCSEGRAEVERRYGPQG